MQNLAVKFLSRNSEDTKLLALMQRLKQSNLDETDRRNTIYNFMKGHYPQSLSADLLNELARWTFLE